MYKTEFKIEMENTCGPNQPYYRATLLEMKFAETKITFLTKFDNTRKFGRDSTIIETYKLRLESEFDQIVQSYRESNYRKP